MAKLSSADAVRADFRHPAPLHRERRLIRLELTITPSGPSPFARDSARFHFRTPRFVPYVSLSLVVNRAWIASISLVTSSNLAF